MLPDVGVRVGAAAASCNTARDVDTVAVAVDTAGMSVTMVRRAVPPIWTAVEGKDQAAGILSVVVAAVGNPVMVRKSSSLRYQLRSHLCLAVVHDIAPEDTQRHRAFLFRCDRCVVVR